MKSRKLYKLVTELSLYILSEKRIKEAGFYPMPHAPLQDSRTGSSPVGNWENPMKCQKTRLFALRIFITGLTHKEPLCRIRRRDGVAAQPRQIPLRGTAKTRRRFVEGSLLDLRVFITGLTHKEGKKGTGMLCTPVPFLARSAGFEPVTLRIGI